MELALVESQLLTLEDVAIAATALAGPRGNDGIQTTGLELLLQSGVDLAVGGVAGGLLLLDGLGLLDLLLGLATLLLSATANGLAVVGLVPLTEGGSVDLDDGGLGQGVGADQLVIGRVVGHGDDTGLAGGALRGPGKITTVETQGTVLVVAATGADNVDALGTDTGLRRLAASFESALLPYCKRSERMFRRVNAFFHPSSRKEKGKKGQSSESDTGFRFFISCMGIVYRFRRTVVGTLGARGGSLVTRVA